MTSVTTSGLGVTAVLALLIAPWSVMPVEPAKVTAPAWMGFQYDLRQGGWAVTPSNLGVARGGVEAISVVVSFLKVQSGLTADQLGRALGVSRRSIHNWAAGGPVASVHEEKIRELGALIASLPGSDPEQRKDALLDSSKGPSLFKQLTSKTNPPPRARYGVPVEERLGL